MLRTMVLGFFLFPLMAVAQGTPSAPDVTGVPSCNEQVRAWRACIAASNKSPPEKATAYAEVNRFINDVRTATDGNRRGLARACVSTSAGYRRMLAEGSCARGLTGLYDDLRQQDAAPPPRRR